MSPRLLAAVALLATAPTAAAESIDELAWLTGRWVGGPEGAYEEVWLAPRAGSLPGTFRWVLDDGRVVLEYIVIEQADDGVWLRFKHFDPDYTAWESESPNTYRLIDLTDQRATFEAASGSDRVPARLVYERDGDALTFTGYGDDPAEAPLELTFELAR